MNILKRSLISATLVAAVFSASAMAQQTPPVDPETMTLDERASLILLQNLRQCLKTERGNVSTKESKNSQTGTQVAIARNAGLEEATRAAARKAGMSEEQIRLSLKALITRDAATIASVLNGMLKGPHEICAAALNIDLVAFQNDLDAIAAKYGLTVLRALDTPTP